MNERFHDNVIYKPTPEELRDGFVLQPTQTVSFDITPPSNAKRRGYQLYDNLWTIGIKVAEIRMGTEQEFAIASIIHLGAEDNCRMLISASDNNMPLLKGQLAPGQQFNIGRGLLNQQHLPQTVSREHCVIGLDLRPWLTIKNHDPRYLTVVRKLL
jgi:hypothetical protein